MTEGAEINEFLAQCLPRIVKDSLFAMLQFAFAIVDERHELVRGPYLNFTTNVLTDVVNGEIKRLIINMPPRHLKSVITSIVLPTFLLLRDPTLKIAVISHSEALATDLGLRSKRLFESETFKQLFPEFQLQTDRCRALHFETMSGGARMGFSIDGGITGFGADYIIIDDPISAKDARSETERAKVNDIFDQAIASRLDDPQQGRIIVVHQRLHDNDLTGYLLNRSPTSWTHLNLPLVAEEDIEYAIGRHVWARKSGEPLLPVYTPEVIAKLKAENGGPIFYTQYQQAPSAATGEILTPEHLQFVDNLPSGSFRTILSADTAIKTTTSACYSALMIIKTDGTRHFVMDVVRRRLDPKALLDAAMDLIGTYGPSIILIEDAASGPGLHSDLKQRGHSSLLRPTRGKSKEERLLKHLNVFAQGRLFIKSNQTWTRSLENELLRFPYASYDDQVDALSMYLEWASEKAITKPTLLSVSGAEQRLARLLPQPPMPPKGEHPMRPQSRASAFRRRW